MFQAPPPYRLSYRFNPTEEALRGEDSLVDREGVSAGETVPFASPVSFVRKAEGSMGMCYDYRAINRIADEGRWSLPYVDDLIEQLHGARWFPKLDLTDGYH